MFELAFVDLNNLDIQFNLDNFHPIYYFPGYDPDVA